MQDNLITKLQSITLDAILNDDEWLKEIDNSGAEINEKVNMVVKAVECPQEYLDFFSALVELLQSIMKKNYNKKWNVTVAAFGSSVTNLALKICDVDIFVKIDPSPIYDKKWFLTLRKILLAYNGELFSDIIFINARVPILKCRHVLDISCDISANNELALKNTGLIKFLVSLNKAFRPFFLMIKFWIKRQCSKIAQSFKGYPVALMTIFFLQQKNLLPSVKSLQANPPAEPCLLNGWNCYFNDDPSCFQHITNQELVVTDLLQDFFDFYSKFEFGFYIISPNCGEKILKPLKIGSESADETWSKFKGYIAVQDVFQLDFCTSSYVQKPALMDFQKRCKEVSATWGESLLLTTLFSKPEVVSKNRRNQSNNLCLIVGNCDFEGNTEEESRDKWFTNTMTVVEDLLQHVARFEILCKQEGSLICRTTTSSIFNRKIRSKVRQDIEKVPETLEPWPETLNSVKVEAVTSAAIAKSETTISEPSEFKISYFLTTMPTQIEFKVETVTKVTDMAHFQVMHSFCQCFANWLSKL